MKREVRKYRAESDGREGGKNKWEERKDKEMEGDVIGRKAH